MLVKSVKQCEALLANDGCRIYELLHPRNDPVALPYSLAAAEVEPGQSSYRHRLKQDEVYYVLEGHGRMHIDADEHEVGVGDAVLIPGGCEQWIDNLGAGILRFIALVSPPWCSEDDVRSG